MKKPKEVIDNGKSPNRIIREAWERGLAVLKPSAAQLERGLALHSTLFTCDGFGFLPSVWSKRLADAWNELVEGDVGAMVLERMMMTMRPAAAAEDPEAGREFVGALDAAGLDCLVLTVAEGKSHEQDIGRMSSAAHLARAFRHRVAQAGSAGEVREIAESGRMAIVWSVNGPPLAGKLEDPDEEFGMLEAWRNLGVRLMHLTYNRRNFVGDGCAEPANAGLSALGRELVGRLNRLGIIVDTSHSGKRTTLDAAAASSKPMMASHTAAEEIYRYARAKSAEEFRAVAKTGGLVGVYVLPMLGPGANLNTMLDHVRLIADLIGPDHVGIGTDTAYQSEWPADLKLYRNARFTTSWWGNWQNVPDSPPSTDEAARGSLAWTNWPLYTVGLVTRGFSDTDIEKILGGNFLRVLAAQGNG